MVAGRKEGLMPRGRTMKRRYPVDNPPTQARRFGRPGVLKLLERLGAEVDELRDRVATLEQKQVEREEVEAGMVD